MKRIKLLVQLFCQILLCVLACNIALSGQDFVYPGDADDNGIVNHLDVIPMAYAYGQVGPLKELYVLDTTFMTITLPWVDTFAAPNLNYAYADANNDGIVNLQDFVVVDQRYEEINTMATQSQFIVPGVYNIDPPMILDSTDLVGQMYTQSDVFELPIILGSPSLPLEELVGVGFTVETESPLIKELIVTFEDAASNWILDNGNGFTFGGDTGDMQKRQVTLGQFGEVGVSGHGRIAKVEGVIEDDIIALLPAGVDSVNVVISIKDILARNELFQPVPIANGNATVVVYHPNYLADKKREEQIKLKINPNPCVQNCMISASHAITYIEVFNTNGQLVASQKGNHQLEQILEMHKGLSTGVYYCRIYTTIGIKNETLFYLR